MKKLLQGGFLLLTPVLSCSINPQKTLSGTFTPVYIAFNQAHQFQVAASGRGIQKRARAPYIVRTSAITSRSAKKNVSVRANADIHIHVKLISVGYLSACCAPMFIARVETGVENLGHSRGK